MFRAQSNSIWNLFSQFSLLKPEARPSFRPRHHAAVIKQPTYPVHARAASGVQSSPTRCAAKKKYTGPTGWQHAQPVLLYTIRGHENIYRERLKESRRPSLQPIPLLVRDTVTLYFLWLRHRDQSGSQYDIRRLKARKRSCIRRKRDMGGHIAPRTKSKVLSVTVLVGDNTSQN